MSNLAELQLRIDAPCRTIFGKKIKILSESILVRYEYENADVRELFINNGDE